MELINGEDETLARRHMVGADEVRKFPVNILVDTGSFMLAINENIQEYLQLPVADSKKAQTTESRMAL